MSDNSENPLAPEPKEKSAKGNIPTSDLDLLNTAKNVSAKWLNEHQITLLWTDANVFAAKVSEYEQVLNARISEGSLRPEISSDLANLDKEIDKGTGFLKDYLKELYGDNDKAHYSQYGIVNVGKSYRIPTDRDLRVSALSLILDSLTKDGLNNKTYGRTFWLNIQSQYISKKNQAQSMDESVSQKVITKNTLKDEIRRTLTALVNSLKANYPDTYESEMRVWGFMKEKY